MAFHIGQKVACVDASACPQWGDLPLRKNQIYTVRQATNYYGVAALELNEVDSPHHSNLYQARRFRPIVDTDISIFTAMLSPSKVDA